MWLYYPRPAGLGGYSSCPADGSYPTTFSPFIIALVGLFLTAPALPAAGLLTTLVARLSISEELGADRAKIALEYSEPGIEFQDITVETPAIPRDLFTPLLPNAPVKENISAAHNIGAALETESWLLYITKHLARLSMKPGAWLFAFTPAFWGIVTWQVRRPRGRRSRRHQH